MLSVGKVGKSKVHCSHRLKYLNSGLMRLILESALSLQKEYKKMPTRKEAPLELQIPPDQVSNEDFWRVVKKILELSPTEKEILIQTYFKGYSTAQIAQNLGLKNQEVVLMLRYRALQQLRSRMSSAIQLEENAEDDADWNELAAEQFLKGYAPSDSIYDDL